MKNKKKKKSKISVFDAFFFWVHENGYTKATYPDSWDKKEERELLIKLGK